MGEGGSGWAVQAGTTELPVMRLRAGVLSLLGADLGCPRETWEGFLGTYIRPLPPLHLCAWSMPILVIFLQSRESEPS